MASDENKKSSAGRLKTVTAGLSRVEKIIVMVFVSG
jgi:hypothetical protein